MNQGGGGPVHPFEHFYRVLNNVTEVEIEMIATVVDELLEERMPSFLLMKVFPLVDLPSIKLEQFDGCQSFQISIIKV